MLDTEVTQRLFKLGDRIAGALEKLGEDPVIDVPVKPPVCPNCETMNPRVRVQESEASGPLFEFVILCECLSCHDPFYAIADGWICTGNIEQVKNMIAERAELAGYDNNGRKDQGTQA
jgi:hypothetical protein